MGAREFAAGRDFKRMDDPLQSPPPAQRPSSEMPHDPLAPLAHRSVAPAYLVPFTVFCIALTLLPLLGPVVLLLTHRQLYWGEINLTDMRPMALVTGAGFAFVLLLRGVLTDFQALTLVGLLVSLAAALLENMASTSGGMLGPNYAALASLMTIGTFVQAVFFLAAALAGWMAKRENPERRPPPRMLVIVITVLAVGYLLLPLDLLLQSFLHQWPTPMEESVIYDRVRLVLWCLVAIGLMIYGLRALAPDPASPGGKDGFPEN